MAIQYAGGTNVNTTFTANVKNDILTAVFSNFPTAGMTIVSGITPSTVTMTIASPCVVTLTAHGLADGTRIVFTTTSALPTGITANTVYFVKSPTTNTFNVATVSGGTPINTTGSQSGTQTMNSEILFQTATTPQGYNLRYRFRDNAGTCIQASIESSDGVKIGGNNTTNGVHLLPGTSKVWRIVANKYQWCMFVPGDFTIAREWALGSCPFIFSFFPTLSYLGLLVGNSKTDTDTTTEVAGDWRYTLIAGNTNAVSNSQVLYNTTMWEDANANWTNSGHIGLVIPVGANTLSGSSQTVWRYGNGDDLTADALITWGLTGPGDEGQIRCQLWDALIIIDEFLGDVTTSFDSHNWVCLTSSQTSASRGALFLVTP